jgi:hypothetical protein
MEVLEKVEFCTPIRSSKLDGDNDMELEPSKKDSPSSSFSPALFQDTTFSSVGGCSGLYRQGSRYVDE